MRGIWRCHILGLLLLVPAVAQSVLADVAADLQQAEGLYRKGQHAQAEQLYKNILTSEADDPEAVYQAARMLPRVYLTTGKLPQVRAAVEQLLAKSARHERLPHALHEIVEQAKGLNKTLEVGQIYQKILSARPSHPQAIWLRMGIAVANVYLGDQSAVEAGVQEIVGQHSSNQWAAEALAQTGWAYDKLEQYGKARPLYEYIVENWPDKPRAIHAHTALVRDCIFLGDEQAAQLRLEQLAQRYGENPSLPGVLSQIGRNYWEVRMYEQSRQVSRYILDNHPEDDHCMWAQRDIVLCDLALRAEEAAAAGTQTLVGKYARCPGAIWAISEVAETYSKLGQHEEARQLFTFNLNNYMERDDNIWSLRGVLNESIALKDDANIDAGIRKLLGEYATSNNLPMAALHVGQELLGAGDSRASKLFQHVIDKHPDHEQAIFVRICMAHVYIRQGQDSRAETVYQRALADYADDPRLAEIVHLMAEGYYDQAFVVRYKGVRSKREWSGSGRAYLNKAIAKWCLIIEQQPEHSHVTPAAHYYVAMTYYQLGDYQKAEEYCTALVTQWPKDARAWEAQLLIAKMYKLMLRDETVSKSDVESKMKSAYEHLVERYPTCPAASGVRNILKAYEASEQGGEK
jgi:tetratricopeptide (TPR) repeat protein